MNRLKSIVLLVALGTFLISANVGDRLIGKWKMEKVVRKGSNIVLKEDNMWMKFETDGTLIFTEGGDDEKRGTWGYDPDLEILYISNRPSKQDEVRIKKLTKKKLVLDVSDETTVYFKRMD